MTRKRTKLRKRKTQRGGTKRKELAAEQEYPEDQNIAQFVTDLIKHDAMKELTERLRKWVPDRDACFHTTVHSLEVLQKGIRNLEPTFQAFLKPHYTKVLAETLETEKMPYVPYDPELHKLFYQSMNEGEIIKIYRILANAMDASQPDFLTQEARDSRLGVILHSYIYKLLTGLGTQYTSTEAVLYYERGPPMLFRFTAPYSAAHPFRLGQRGGTKKRKSRRPVPEVYSDLRNLCVLLRDTLGMVNFLFRAAWPTQMRSVPGRTQYAHSGGNIFYLLSMMLSYLHRNQGLVYETDILEQIRQAFDDALGVEKGMFYSYLDAFMANPTCRRLIHNNTLSISDVDFLLLTDNPDVLRHRTELKNITMMMAGQVVAECSKGLDTPSADNIALKVILPKRRAYTADWPAFKISDFTHTPHEITDMINRLETDKLRGIRITGSDIEQLHILLVRVKVAIDANVTMDDEYKRIFAEKLDFVIGSMESDFYSDKQGRFSIGKYYSLITFLNELAKILLNSADDKSPKRMDRYSFTHILVLIQQMATDDADPATVVHDAVSVSTTVQRYEETVGKNWFNLLLCILFHFLDPTAEGCAPETLRQQTTSLMVQSVIRSLRSTGHEAANMGAANAGAANAGDRSFEFKRPPLVEASHVLADAGRSYEEAIAEIDRLMTAKTEELSAGLIARVPKSRSRSVPKTSTKLTRQRSMSASNVRSGP